MSMNNKSLWVVMLAGLCACQMAWGQIQVSTHVTDGRVAGPFSTGEVVPVTLSISGGESALLGVEMDFSCPGDEVRIAGVEVNPALGMALDASATEFPASRCRLMRVQPPLAIDESFGVGDGPVWLARIQLEVGSTEFASAEFRYCVRCISSPPGAATTTPAAGQGEALTSEHLGKVELVNRSAVDMETDENGVLLPPWSLQTGELIVQVRPAGGGLPVTELTPGIAYTVCSGGPLGRAEDYAAYFASADPQIGVASASAPTAGPWASAEVTLADMSAAPGSPAGSDLPDGYEHRWMIAGTLPTPQTPEGPEGVPGAGGPNGPMPMPPVPPLGRPLFTFTASPAAGPCILEVHLWQMNRATRTCTELVGTAELSIDSE